MAVTVGKRSAETEAGSGWSWLHRRETRQLVGQAIIIVTLAALIWMVVSNTITNLRKQNIASGFGFWDNTAGFDISQTLINYSATSSYGDAFWVGLTNTLLVSAIGIVLATIVGFTMGIARLSNNWIIARLATVYIETIRNVPLLLQLFVWYFAVLALLGGPRQSLTLPESLDVGLFGYSFFKIGLPKGLFYLSNRGLSLPAPVFQPGAQFILLAFLVGVASSFLIAKWAKRRRDMTGEQFPVGWTTVGLILGLPFLAAIATGFPVSFDYPVLRGFNFQGGFVVLPELMALLLGLTIYTGAFIAEIVRAGIQGVGTGQKEAARALGLTNGQMLKLVVIPQAMRIIIPPLTSQFLNLTKNSSLGIAIAYPDLVGVFAGTVLNQTGQAVEVILITMLVYLTLSLLTSAFMNWFNTRMKLVER
jgi:general L-amino acid transport system permease protein